MILYMRKQVKHIKLQTYFVRKIWDIFESEECLLMFDRPQVRIDRLNEHWTSSLSVGLMAADTFCLGVSAVGMKQPCWVVQDSSVFNSGVKVRQIAVSLVVSVNWIKVI